MEDFVPRELAIKLKEKGFKEKCYAYYFPVNNELIHNTNQFRGGNLYDCLHSYNSLPKEVATSDFIDAPTITQVMKWLRVKKEIDIVIYPIDANTVFMGGEKYILSVYISRKRDYKLHHDNKDKYVKWEEAALAGMNYCLDNLI
jgi:hypothetical protein